MLLHILIFLHTSLLPLFYFHAIKLTTGKVYFIGYKMLKQIEQIENEFNNEPPE